jgi:hypothetical protein
MEVFLVTVALLLLLLMVAASASPAFFAVARAMSRREPELELWQMMRRRGLVADDPSVRPGDMARAIRRCTFCPSVDVCHRWLAAERGEGAEEFCPNLRFFQSLESAQHH